MTSSGIISMASEGTFSIASESADSYILFGDAKSNEDNDSFHPAFYVKQGGDITAKSISVDSLYVKNVNYLETETDGLERVNVVVGSSAPTSNTNNQYGHGTLLLWANTTASVTYTYDPSASGNSNLGWTSGSSDTRTFSKNGSNQLTGTNCRYGVYFRIYNWNGRCIYRDINIHAKKGSAWILIGHVDSTGVVEDGAYATINTLNNT